MKCSNLFFLLLALSVVSVFGVLGVCALVLLSFSSLVLFPTCPLVRVSFMECRNSLSVILVLLVLRACALLDGP